MTKIIIKNKNGQLKSDIFFHPDAASLMVANNTFEENLYFKLAFALSQQPEENFPVYVYKIFRAPNNVCKVIIKTLDGPVEICKIQLAEKIQDCHNINSTFISSTDFLYEQIENHSTPFYLDFDKPENSNVLNLFKRFEEDLLKQQQRDFNSGQISIVSEIRGKPIFQPPQLENNLPELAKHFTSLQAYQAKVAELNELKKTFDKIEQEHANYLEIKNKNPKLKAFIKKNGAKLGILKILKEILDMQAETLEIQRNINEIFQPLISQYITDNAVIGYVKDYLAWALHKGIQDYFDFIQKETAGSEKAAKLRQKKIEEFNLHCGTFISINTENLVLRVEDIFAKLTKKTLNEIKAFINYVLAEQFNTSNFGTSSDKQKLLVSALKIASNLEGMKHILQERPFTATDKSLFKPANFVWSREVETSEQRLIKTPQIINQYILSNPKFKPLRHFSIEDLKLKVKGMPNKILNFQKQIAKQEKLFAAQDRAKELLDQATQAQQDCLSLHKDLSNLIAEVKKIFLNAKEPFIINNIAYDEAGLQCYIDKTLTNIDKCFNQLSSQEKKIQTIQYLEHVKEVKTLTENIQACVSEINDAHLHLQYLHEQMQRYMVTITIKRREKEIKSIQAQQILYQADISRNYNLEDIAGLKKFDTDPELQTLIAEYSALKDFFNQPQQIHAFNKNIDNQLMRIKNLTAENFEKMKNIFAQISEIVKLKQSDSEIINDNKKKTLISDVSSFPTRRLITRRKPNESTPGPKQSAETINPNIIKNKTSFFKTHKKSLLIGGAIGIISTSVLIASIFTFGLAGVTFASVIGFSAGFYGSLVPPLASGIISLTLLSLANIAVTACTSTVVSTLFHKCISFRTKKRTQAVSEFPQEKNSEPPLTHEFIRKNMGAKTQNTFITHRVESKTQEEVSSTPMKKPTEFKSDTHSKLFRSISSASLPENLPTLNEDIPTIPVSASI